MMLLNAFVRHLRRERRLHRPISSRHLQASLEALEPRLAPAATVELFADLVTTGSSVPTSLIEYSGALYFAAQTQSDGNQWWRLDGDGEVTLASNTTPRRGVAARNDAVVFNDELHLPFVGGGGLGGFPLYKINSQGEFLPAVEDDDWLGQVAPEHLTVFGDALYYAGGAFEDRELWRGDAAGDHHRVADIHAEGSSQPSDLTVMGDVLYFSADDGVHGRELWKSDAEGNVALVSDIVAGNESSNPEQLTLFGDDLYFWAQSAPGGSNALWKVDAGGNVQQAAELYAAPDKLVRPGMTVFDGHLYFFAADATGTEQLWKLSAKGNATVAAAVSPGLTPPAAMAVFGDALYFPAHDDMNDYELWKLGRSGPATPVTSFARRDPFPFGEASFQVFGGELYFPAGDQLNDIELWKIDAQGAVKLAADLDPGSSLPGNFTSFGDRLYFSALSETWTLDRQGNAALTLDLAGHLGSSPSQYTPFGGNLYFTAATPEAGTELWKLDAPDQASLVADIRPGEESSFPVALTPASDALFFRAWDDEHGRELWRMNSQGVVEMVADVWPGPEHSTPRELSPLGDSLYFAARHPELGEELWRLDGQDNLTLFDLRPGPQSSRPEGLIELGGAIYFAATDDDHGRELWKVSADGNVSLVADVTPGAAWFNPGGLVVFNNALYMRAQTAASGGELWKMDAQEQFRQVTDIGPGPASALSGATRLAPNDGLVFGNELYFRADDGVHGQELWKLDAEDHAELVADIYPGPGHSRPGEFASFDGALYFSATGGRGQGGREVWRLTPEIAHHNEEFPADVNADGQAGTADLLEIVTHLRAGGPTLLSGAANAPPYVDVNGDGLANAADLLEVVTVLRRQAAVASEGERPLTDTPQELLPNDMMLSVLFLLDDEELHRLAEDLAFMGTDPPSGDA